MTSTFQSSFILSDLMHGEGSASASLPANEPQECGPDTTTGIGRSVFQVSFSTDADYEFILGSPYVQSNAGIQLLQETGGSPVVIHSFAGTGMVSYDEVHGPGTYTFLALAEADEDLENPYFNVDLRLVEATPQVDAGRASGLLASTMAGDLHLEWQASCTPDDDDYAIYSGTLGMFTSHSQLQCSTLGVTSATLPMPSGSRYYLIVPLDGSSEGSYGLTGDGTERPIGATTCGTQAIAASCP